MTMEFIATKRSTFTEFFVCHWVDTTTTHCSDSKYNPFFFGFFELPVQSCYIHLYLKYQLIDTGGLKLTTKILLYIGLGFKMFIHKLSKE